MGRTRRKIDNLYKEKKIKEVGRPSKRNKKPADIPDNDDQQTAKLKKIADKYPIPEEWLEE